MVFEKIELDWKGKTYSLDGDAQIMRTLAAIEEHITFMEIEQARAHSRPPLAKLSTAYAIVLNHAGCQVSPAEVYSGMWEKGATAKMIGEAIAGLLQLMIPPSVANEPKKSSAKTAPKGRGVKSSKPRTRSRS